MKKITAGVLSLLLCLITLISAVPVFAVRGEMPLLTVNGDTVAKNTENAFTAVTSGSEYGGISLSGDYGSPELSVALISRRLDRFIIELNGHTLTLGYLAADMNVELRGAGTVIVGGGTVVYSGEFYLGENVTLTTDSRTAVTVYGETASVRLGDGVCFSGASAAEIGLRYEYNLNPIIFDTLPASMRGNAEGGSAGSDFYRVVYENGAKETPPVSTARIARFPSEQDAASALEKGLIALINPLDSADNDNSEDDSFMKTVGDTVSVGKSGALLSHVNLSLDGSLGVNLYFELSGVEGSVDSLGALVFSGVGEGGSIPIPQKNENGLYKFTIRISPMDMARNISVHFEGDTDGRSWEYSVVKYARYILSDPDETFGRDIKDLIASMLHYGAALQRLNGETEQLADALLSEFPAYATPERIAEKTASAVDRVLGSGYAHGDISYSDSENPAVTFKGMTLAVNDVTAIRLYLGDGYPVDGRLSYFVTYSETTLEGSVYEKTVPLDASVISERGYVEISGIPARDFGRIFRVSVRDNVNSEIVATCELNAFFYAGTLYALSAEGSSDRGLAEAAIWFGFCNATYFHGA